MNVTSNVLPQTQFEDVDQLVVALEQSKITAKEERKAYVRAEKARRREMKKERRRRNAGSSEGSSRQP